MERKHEPTEMTLLRHLLSILLLPFVVTVVVPRWILVANGGASLCSGSCGALDLVRIGLGAALLIAGLGLGAWCVLLFARVGRGTLAPWDPTQRLVVVGPYRYVRNPMISGVLTILLGESLLFGSRRLLAWAVGFWLLNTVYFIFSEEPGLEQRFGEDYREYRARVPRWVPRLTPWPEDRR